MIKKKATRKNSVTRNVTTKGKKKENKSEVDNPFDMVNVTSLKLVLRSASAGGDVIEFVWRVQVRIAPCAVLPVACHAALMLPGRRPPDASYCTAVAHATTTGNPTPAHIVIPLLTYVWCADVRGVPTLSATMNPNPIRASARPRPISATTSPPSSAPRA